MQHEVLQDIMEYARCKLVSTYGYCNVSNGADTARLETDDHNGHDVKITITSVAEKSWVRRQQN